MRGPAAISVLVFGAGGQLGASLVERAAADDSLRLDALSRAEADITDAAAIDAALAARTPDVAVAAAAYTAVDRAESEPLAAMRVNAIGATLLGSACARRGVPLVHLSTDYVFDGTKAAAYTEDDPVAPLGVYGLSKAAGEAGVLGAGGRAAILRTAWVYGPHGANILKTIVRLARERDELRFVEDQRGSPTSSLDLADAVLVAARALVAGTLSPGIYHVAGSGTASWAEVAAAAVDLAAPRIGRRPVVTPIPTSAFPTPARRPANSVLDSAKFAAATGWRAPAWEMSLAVAVDRLLTSD